MSKARCLGSNSAPGTVARAKSYNQSTNQIRDVVQKGKSTGQCLFYVLCGPDVCVEIFPNQLCTVYYGYYTGIKFHGETR
jgi:hypothetical protein